MSTPVTDSESASPVVRAREKTWAVGAGALAGGFAALVLAVFLPSGQAGAMALPVWVRVVAVVLVVLGVGAVVMPKGRGWWLFGLGVGAVVLEIWAVAPGIDEIRFGLPGLAIPVLAVGGVAVIAAAVLLAIARWASGFGARQVVPATVALVAVGVLTATTVVVAPHIVVDAATAEQADPAPVPEPSTGARWTSTWPPRDDFFQVVAAGAGVVVASGDGVAALDGSTGRQRWHYRRAGARAYRLHASPDGRTVAAVFSVGHDEDTTYSMFVFDANTGDIRWSRWGNHPRIYLRDDNVLTNHVMVINERRGMVGYDLGSGDEVWRWTEPLGCRFTVGEYVTSSDSVLVPMACGGGHVAYTILGVDDQDGTERWRFADPNEFTDEGKRLVTAPDGRTALLQSELEPYGGILSALLDSATGKVLYQTASGDRGVIAPDPQTPVVLREVSGERGELVIRNLRTGAEHPLAHTCPAFQHLSEDYWPKPDMLASAARVVITKTSVVVLCDDEEVAKNVTIETYSRTDGTRTASLTATETRIPIDRLTGATTLFAAAGAIMLAHHDPARESGVVAGLS